MSNEIESLTEWSHPFYLEKSGLVNSTEYEINKYSDIFLPRNMYGQTYVNVPRVITHYGAGKGTIYNFERTGQRNSYFEDFLRTGLSITGGKLVCGPLYQYCGICQNVQAIVHTDTNLHANSVEIGVPFISVSDLTLDGGNITFNGRTSYKSFLEIAIALYGIHTDGVNHRSSCALYNWNVDLDYIRRNYAKFVDMSPVSACITTISRNPYRDPQDIILSALLRCPKQPTRSLDVDAIVFDAYNRPVAVLEESSNPKKVTTMSEVVAAQLGSETLPCRTVRVITETANGHKARAWGRSRNEDIPGECWGNSYGELVETLNRIITARNQYQR